MSVPYAPVARRTERAWTLIWATALSLVLAALVLTRRAVRAARRLDHAFARERRYGEHVAHQLRTPLTSMLIGLEAALERPGADLGAVIRTAVRRGHRLADTVDDMLLLARGRQVRELLDVRHLLDGVRDVWLPQAERAGRRLTVHVPARFPRVRAARAALVQILNVLVDNALAHGRGDITLTARHRGTVVAIDVADRGVAGHRRAAPAGHGIGLALARALAEAEGGRLLARTDGPTAYTVEIPVCAQPLACRGAVPETTAQSPAT
ncbi:HAMP domain-containing sensor histidine kinase [Actinomadura sp. NPDC047616]|uniref:sensor histidine kinase n=1 Tax=Actinomadura sp. NPDC047616 TaxID=3155914 RepID=UPI0033FDCB5F